MTNRKRTRKLAKYQRARHCEWLAITTTEIARLEGRLGLLTDEAQTDFYGPGYLDPDQKLGKLLEATMAGA